MPKLYEKHADYMTVLLENVTEEFSNELGPCPVCGSRFDKVIKSGRVGCSSCYATFDVALCRLLGGSHYKGKPAKAKLRIKGEIDDLVRLQREAIIEEDYERAADLRDKITVLEDMLFKKG